MQLVIDLVADWVCPWCYIGKRHLDIALADLAARRPELDVSVRWLPFFLNPDTPPEGEPYRPFLERKFGGPQAVESVWSRVRQAGAEAGVDFAFERIAMRPSTLQAHRLVQRLQALDRPGSLVAAVVEDIFAAHFAGGEDIGDPAVLAGIAARHGEDAGEIALFLTSDVGREAVLAMAAQAQEAGVGGVPFYIINHQAAVSGAQPPAVLAQAIASVVAV